MKRHSKCNRRPVRLRERRLAGEGIDLCIDINVSDIARYKTLHLCISPVISPAPSTPASFPTCPATSPAPSIPASFPTCPTTSPTAPAASPAPVTLMEWLESYEQEDTGFRPSTLKGRSDMRKKVQEFLRHKNIQQIAISDVDASFCRSFIRFLSSAKNSVCTVNERIIKQGCAHHHQAVFNGALNRAVRLGLLPANPMKSLDRRERIQPSTEEREYLTIDELRTLMATPCTSDQIKKAFVFSCFTGLRLSDVRTLTWKMVRKSPDGSSLSAHVVMRKTRKPNIIPLSQEALNCLQPKADPDEPIFGLPAGYATVNYHIKKWVRAAGIDKTISYHCSRHTFATMMLTLGADVYTTSKLLGHSDVATTAIYAKIVDKKKVETVNLVGHIFRVGSGQEKVEAETV